MARGGGGSKHESEIVSVSMDAETLERTDRLSKSLGFKSRSKLLRTAVSSLISEYEQASRLKGRKSAVVVVRHGRKQEDRVTDEVHEFSDIITSTMHVQGQDDCSEIMVVEGEADRIRELHGKLRAKKGVHGVMLSVM